MMLNNLRRFLMARCRASKDILTYIFSPANVDAAKMWRDDRAQFRKIARRHCNKVNYFVPCYFVQANIHIS